MRMNTVDISEKANELLVKWSNGRDKAIADYHYYCGLIDGINQYLSGLNTLNSVIGDSKYEQEVESIETEGKQEWTEIENGNSYEIRLQRTEASEAL